MLIMSNSITISAEEKIYFHIGHNIIQELITYLSEKNVHHIILVTDENEYKALGARVEKALRRANFDIKNVVLQGKEICADERSIVQALLASDDVEQLYIAIGSGTVTDIVRFVSHRTRSYFISLPTAPSVDGFASNVAAMYIMDYKQSLISRSPCTIFADLDTLCKAPRPLIAAGFGDMFGKFSALADWKLAHILLEDRYDANIAQRSKQARDNVVAQAKRLEKDWENSIRSLMKALYEEGLCMLNFGNSRPASGSEHLFSHYWEMKLLRENRPAILHGSKVGLASIYIARIYEMIRKTSKIEAIEKLNNTPKFDPDEEIQKIISGYGEKVSGQIIKIQHEHLQRTEEEYRSLKEKIVDNWETIQDIAAEVPPEAEIISLLKSISGATQPEEIGLNNADVRDAFDYAQYVRGMFTVLNLIQMLGLKLEPMIQLPIKQQII